MRFHLSPLFVVVSVLLVAAPAAAQLDPTEAMPVLGPLDATGAPLATACAGADAAACTLLADVHLRAGEGRIANALYRRAADLSRALEPARAPALRAPGTVRSTALAIAALEAAWDPVVVPAAGSMRELALDARPQVFGTRSAAAWSGRRARASDAYRTVHTMRTREGAVFTALAWIGDLASLATPAELWELHFAYANLDFVAYVSDAGELVALVHVPEG